VCTHDDVDGSGHGPDDIQPFQHIVEGQDGQLTNAQLYDIMSPFTASLCNML
jgi:hypothetical protein